MPEAVAGNDWSNREIDLIIADYFDMLALELAGRHGIEPETCRSFELVAHGLFDPKVVEPEDFDHAEKDIRTSLMELHRPLGILPA